MAHYMVTLVIETDPDQGMPGDWDWQELVDSPLPVTVVACTPVGDDPADSSVELLHERMADVHDMFGRYLA